MERYVTADCHFAHANIIKHCSRPFENEWQMNQALIKNWNEVVKDEDEIYILGDFAFGAPGYVNNHVCQHLNGKKFFIRGNHDKTALNGNKKFKWFEWVKDYHEIKHDNKVICMFHYPIQEWNKKYHGSYHFHGHSHGNAPTAMKRLDVGFDVHNFRPISVEEAIEIIDKRDEENQARIDHGIFS